MNLIVKNKVIVLLSLSLFVLFNLPVAAQKKKANSDDLLKMALYEANTMGNNSKAIDLCKRALRLSPDYIDVHQLLGKLYQVTGDNELCRNEYLFLLKKDHENIDFLLSLFNLESSLKNYREALGYINLALDIQKSNEDLLFRKAYLLEEMGDHENAVLISGQLYQNYPGNNKYKGMFSEQLYQLSKQQLRTGKVEDAMMTLGRLITIDPNHRDALINLVNLSYSRGNYKDAINYCNKGLELNSADSVFLLKKSAFLMESGYPKEAITIAGLLANKYPDQERYKKIYYDQLLTYGVQLKKADSLKEASEVFIKMHAAFPMDTVSLQHLGINMLQEKRYEEAVVYIDKGLVLVPGSYKFLSLKTEALESGGKYDEAYRTAKQLLVANPGDLKLRSYANYLLFKSKKNQVGVMHLQSIYDNGVTPGSITTLQYLRFHKQGSIGGRINYANRNHEQAVQFELESYLKHNQYLYSYMTGGWATNDVLPRWRAGYSLFINLGQNWEGELGTRYLYSGGSNIWSGVYSASKTWKKNWTNFRGYIINDAGEWYHAYSLTSRFFLRKPNEYVSFIGGLGTSPDDRSRNFQINNLLGFISHSTGLGIQKTIKTNTLVNLTGVWTNQKISEKRVYNQYDITFTLLQMF